jgi:hypothetical protein
MRTVNLHPYGEWLYQQEYKDYVQFILTLISLHCFHIYLDRVPYEAVRKWRGWSSDLHITRFKDIAYFLNWQD